MARQHHPDKGGDVEVFKGVQEAHEVLSDERRRQVYDATGSVNEQQQHQGPPPGSFPFSDMFNMFGGGGGGGRPMRGGKGPSNLVNVGMKLENFYHGFEINLNFKQTRKCRDCLSSYSTCGICRGSGYRAAMQRLGHMTIQTQVPCNECNASGQSGSSAGCSGCSGKRMVDRERSMVAKVVPGMRVGEQIIFEGECSETLECDTPGDIVVSLNMEKSNYEWNGDDLHYVHTITYAESILGFESTLKDHPNGKNPVCRWENGPIINGTVLTMAGGGMPRKRGGFGDLKLTIQIQTPKITLTDADREVLGRIFGSPNFVSTSYQSLSA